MHQKLCILCASYLHCKITCFLHVPWNTPYTHLWKGVSLTLIGSLKNGFCFWKTLSWCQQQNFIAMLFILKGVCGDPNANALMMSWPNWLRLKLKKNEESKVENGESKRVQGWWPSVREAYWMYFIVMALLTWLERTKTKWIKSNGTSLK